MGVVIDKAELRSMSRAERHELAVLLAEFDEAVGTNELVPAGEPAGPGGNELVSANGLVNTASRKRPVRDVRPDSYCAIRQIGGRKIDGDAACRQGKARGDERRA